MLFVIGAIAIVIVAYNRIAALAQKRRSAFADIDVQLEQRYNTIPNMVTVVKEYAGHENKIFSEVTAARSATKDVFGIGAARFKAEDLFSKAIINMLAIAENYPDLKANQNFLYLQQELSDLENKISAARRFFNSATAEYNTSIKQFPGNVLARMFHFYEEPFFEIEGDKDEVRAAPDIEGNKKKEPAKAKGK